MIGRLKAAVAAVAIAIAAIVAAFQRGAAKGRRQKENEANVKTLEALETGREAVRDGRSAGDPADRLRKNDGRW